MRDVAVRQSRLSPVRDFEQPRPLGFTLTGQTLDEGEGSRGEDRAGVFISYEKLKKRTFLIEIVTPFCYRVDFICVIIKCELRFYFWLLTCE